MINKKEAMSRCLDVIVVNLQNTKDTEKILTSARPKKRQIIYKGTVIRLTVYFSTGTMEAR